MVAYLVSNFDGHFLRHSEAEGTVRRLDLHQENVRAIR
jgi:hypothetical protein